MKVQSTCFFPLSKINMNIKFKKKLRFQKPTESCDTKKQECMSREKKH